MTQLTLFSDLTASHPSGVSKPELDTLSRLATLVRDGQAQMKAQSQRRSRPIQSIGDLAQSVLLRHDLVARRRAAAASPASVVAVSQPTVTRLPVVAVEHVPAPVQVAS